MTRKLVRAVTLIVLAAWLAVGLLAAPAIPSARASGGSYSLSWSAADPTPNKGPFAPTYTKVPPPQTCPSGGRASDPMANAVYGSPTDSVSSLEPSDMALGMIVPFEVLISVSGSTSPENGVIQFTGGWATKTTSGGDFGFDPNYMVYCAFVDYGDAATVDPGSNAKVDSVSSVLLNPGTATEEFQGTIQVSGLDNGDKVVVEIWVVLKSAWPIGGATGNVQSWLRRAQTVYTPPDTINTGNQTVPLNKVGDFTAVDVDLALTKTDDDVWKSIGEDYWYEITVSYPYNASYGAVANNVIVTDNFDPFVKYLGSYNITAPRSLGQTCSGPTGTFPDGAGGTWTCDLKNMTMGETVTIRFLVEAVPGVPLTSLQEIDNTTPPAMCTMGTRTTPPSSGDVCDKACVATISDDRSATNNCDDEPKDIKYPTAVTLKSFTVTAHVDYNELSWVTTSEVNNMGFNIYRATSLQARRIQINDELIPTIPSPGSSEGAEYTYEDPSAHRGPTYYYWLEAVDIYGQTTLYGPESVRLLDKRPALRPTTQ